MNFDLKQPCGECPFRRDCSRGWLGHDRAEGITQSLEKGACFTCHKTGPNREHPDAQFCAGAILTMRGNGTWSRALHAAMLLGLFDFNQMNREAERKVFASFDEFINHHAQYDLFFEDLICAGHLDVEGSEPILLAPDDERVRQVRDELRQHLAAKEAVT